MEGSFLIRHQLCIYEKVNAQYQAFRGIVNNGYKFQNNFLILSCITFISKHL